MSTTVVTPSDEELLLQYQDNLRGAGRKEPPTIQKDEPKAEAKVEPKIEEQVKTPEVRPDPEKSHLNRRERRLIAQNAEFRTRLEMLERQTQKQGGDPAAVATPEDPEPDRAKYADDAAYWRAIGAWEARKETSKQVAPIKAKQDEIDRRRDEEEEIRLVQEASKQNVADIDLFPDWRDLERSHGSKFRYNATVTVDINGVPTQVPSVLHKLLERSPNTTKILHYAFTEDPEQFKYVDSLWQDPAKQIEAFRAMEAEVKGFYRGRKAPVAAKEPEKKVEPVEAPKKPTAAELDAALPKPTGETSPRTRGQSPQTSESLVVEGDESTANPKMLEEYQRLLAGR